MFSWAPLLVMGPGTVYRLYPPLDGAGVICRYVVDLATLQLQYCVFTSFNDFLFLGRNSWTHWSWEKFDYVSAVPNY